MVCVCVFMLDLSLLFLYICVWYVHICMYVCLYTNTYIPTSVYICTKFVSVCIYIHIFLFIYTLSRFPWSLRHSISDKCGIWKLLKSPYLTVKLCFTQRQWEHWMQKWRALWEWRELRWSRVTSETCAGLYTGLGRLLCSSLLLLLPGPLLLSWNKLEECQADRGCRDKMLLEPCTVIGSDEQSCVGWEGKGKSQGQEGKVYQNPPSAERVGSVEAYTACCYVFPSLFVGLTFSFTC